MGLRDTVDTCRKYCRTMAAQAAARGCEKLVPLIGAGGEGGVKQGGGRVSECGAGLAWPADRCIVYSTVNV